MQDEPAPALLIGEVRKALEAGIAPGFAQKVAANALGIALRELTLAPASAAAENGRLARLVGDDGDLADRNHRLAELIRRGEGELPDGVIAHLIATTVEKIAVDQPAYPAFVNWRGDDGAI